jgi:hypothetical protein
MRIPLVVVALVASLVSVTAAQDVSKFVTKADVEKAAGATFDAGTTPMGALSADFEKPRVQLRVAVSGAKTPAQAMQIVTELARAVAPRVGE